MPLVGDRVRLASRPHRSLRRLRRRLFASAPPPMHQPSHAPGPAAAGRRYRRALSQVVARRFPSLCTRPRRPPPSPPLVATFIAAAANDSTIRSVSLRRSQRCAERQNLLRKWPILKQKGGKKFAGLRPVPRRRASSCHFCQVLHLSLRPSYGFQLGHCCSNGSATSRVATNRWTCSACCWGDRARAGSW